MNEEIIGKKCLSTNLISGLYPSLNFGEYTLEVGPVFWSLLLDGSIVTHCYQISDISEYHLEQLVSCELLSITTNKSETEIKIGNYVLRLNSFKGDNYVHFRIFNQIQSTDNSLQKFMSNIPNITCSNVSNTFGTTVLIDFGNKNDESKYPFTIMIESSNWSIQDGNSQTSLEKLLGSKLTDIQPDIEKFESDLIFDNGIKIHTRPSGLNTSHWTLSLDGNHLTYGPKDIISIS